MKYLGLIPNISNEEVGKCEMCFKAKYSEKPFEQITKRVKWTSGTSPFRISWVKIIETRGGKRYYMTFFDELF